MRRTRVRLSCKLTAMKYFVLGDILRELRRQGLEVREHQVLYVIRKLKLKPAMRAGEYRLFDEAAFKAIRKALKEREGR